MSYSNYRIDKVVPYFSSIRTNTLDAPVSIQLLLTDYCFCKCNMCTHWKMKSKNVMSFDTYKKIFDDLTSHKSFESIAFSGGDPLAHPEINKIIEYSSYKDISLGMITAGIPTSKIKWSLFKKLEWIRVSLDAATRETYKKIRGVDRFFEVTQFIKIASEITNVGINFTIQKDNYHELIQIIRLAKELGVNRFIINPAFGGDFELTTEMKKEVLSYIRKYSISFFEENFNDVIEKFENDIVGYKIGTSTELKEVPCIVPKLHAFIRPNGEVYPCCILGDDLHGDEVQRDGFMFNVNDYDSLSLGWRQNKDMFDNLTNKTISEKCKYCTERLYLTNVMYNKWKHTKTFI